MLRHNVMWKLREENKAANLAEAERLLRACATLTPGLLPFEVDTAQPGCEATDDPILKSSFTDHAALVAQQNHPKHVAIKPFMKTVVLERQCMDYEI